MDRTTSLGAPKPRPFATLRELLAAFAAWFLIAFAFQFFDEGRILLRPLAHLVVPGLIAFFVGRAVWRWWGHQPPSISGAGATAGLVVALVGWANVGLANHVAHMSSGNYALIIIVPILWLLGLLVSFAGLVAVGLGIASVITGLRREFPGREWVIAGGASAAILNLAHIYRLIGIFSGR